MKRSPISRKKPLKGSVLRPKRKQNPQWGNTRREVFDRAGGLCEARLDKCDGEAHHAHHKLRRSQGGKDEPDNLLALCFWCHEWIHGHPEEARLRGWLLSAHAGSSELVDD